MKQILCFLLTIVMLFSLCLSAGAAAPDLTDTGKTVVEYGDWMLERIENGTYWELDEYIGSDEVIYPLRSVGDILVVKLGDHIFANNTSIKSVITSSPMWTVGDYAFTDCTSLESFECNYAMRSIGVGAFSGASALKSINLQDSVITGVSAHCFARSGVTQITLPSACTSIGESAFYDCDSLTSVTIPDSVTGIDDMAFADCDKLTIYCNTDSYAHEYAQAKGIAFVLLDSPDTIRFLLGDADGDDVITISDVTTIQRVLAELEQDDDGMIALRVTNGAEDLNIFHATEIQRWLARLPIERDINELIIRSKL